MKPVIGMVARVEYPGETGKLVMNERYRKIVIEYGGNPILIMPPQNIDYTKTKYDDQEELTSEEKEMLITQIKFCDGIIMTGGFKINKFDRFISEYATDNDIPLLGICLGMQIMANYKKKLWIVKNDSYIIHKREEGDCFHKISLDKKSKLYEIMKEDRLLVNSRHYYHTEPNDNYDIVAVTDDHYIEAIEMKNKRFNIGVQWHPEDMDDEYSDRLFKKFFSECKRKREM